MHVLILQYAGDYREAFNRLAQGGKETYYAQKYSVEAVSELRQKVEAVSVVCCMGETPYDEILENGVRAIGAGFQGQVQPERLIQLLEKLNPTHLVVQTPIPSVLKWAIRKRVKTLAVFAESIITKGWRNKFQSFRLAKLLNHKQIDWTGSYGITSSVSLNNMGVKSDKIIPWDFLIDETPGSYAPKQLLNRLNPTLLYVGSMSEAKGVGDILDAVAELHARKRPVTLKLVGRDVGEEFLNKAKRLQIEDHVEFLGILPNSTIVPLMRQSDLVLVPSRHNYPEGFPLVIHHALCARTPIIASTHPMFVHHLKHSETAMIFSSGNPNALADCIKKTIADPELYFRLSEAAYDTWYKLRLPVKWADLINQWVLNSNSSQQWLFEHRLSSERYSSTRSQSLNRWKNPIQDNTSPIERTFAIKTTPSN